MMTYASPVYYPGRQRQSNPAPDVSSVQMPLFSHGDEAQGDTISSHNSPVVPGGQVQINCLGFSRSNVSENGKDCVSKYSIDGDFIGLLNFGPLPFRNPHGITVNDTGTVYVCDTGNDRVQKFKA